LSSTEIINHVNTTLYNILRESLQPLAPDLNITFGSPADEDGSASDSAPRLLVFLYNIIEDPFSRNRPDEFRGGNRLLSFKRPLAVNLYYMLTPFSGPSGSTDANARIRVQGHNMIALAMRAFNDNGLINPKFFPADTTLGESQVRISSVQMNLEEITKIWSSFNKPYRLSVCYEVSVIRVQSEKVPKEVHVVERAAFSSGTGGSEGEFEVVPAIGKRNLSKLKDKGWNLNALRSDELGGISNVRPVAVQPGMALSIYGRNFKDKKLRVKIGDNIITDGRKIDEEVDEEVDKAISDSQEINETLLRTLLKTLLGRLLGTSFRVITENLIKVKIFPNEVPGIKTLSLAAEEQEQEQEAYMATFEVVPSEPRLITITEVRPDKGISGDLITVYGINFTEDARVSIGNAEITKVTFVDSTQINIMIPPGIPSAITELKVKTDQGTASIQFRIL
jgi:hypothetical protein